MTPDFLLIGHFTADLLPDGERVLGGTVSYAARTAHALGLRVAALTSALPDDPLLDELAHSAQVVSLPADETTTFENVYTDAGREQYVRGFASPLRAEHIPAAWRDAPLVFLAPIAGEYDPVMAHHFPNATVLLTLQGCLRQWGDDGLVKFKHWFNAEALEAIDIIVFSELDILEAPELESELAKIVPHLFVTRAENGGTYYYNGVPLNYITPQVEVVQQTGAGDVFAAVILACHHLYAGNMAVAIEAAARLGALAVTRPGLEGTPTPHEAAAALKEAKRLHEPR